MNIAQIITLNQLIFLSIFVFVPLNAQEVPGTVIFHAPVGKEPISPQTPFRKPAEATPPEKPTLPKVNSPVVPGSAPAAAEEPAAVEKPARRPPASQRKTVLPPTDLKPEAPADIPKEMPEGRKPVSLLEASPIVFAHGPIAIYPWQEAEEYFEDDPKKIIHLTARIMRSEQIVLGDTFLRTKFPERQGVLTIFPVPQIAEIPLSNTYFSQDILFLDDNGVIRQMIYKTDPKSPTTALSKTKTRSVLQLNAGSIKKLGIKLGDKVAIPPR